MVLASCSGTTTILRATTTHFSQSRSNPKFSAFITRLYPTNLDFSFTGVWPSIPGTPRQQRTCCGTSPSTTSGSLIYTKICRGPMPLHRSSVSPSAFFHPQLRTDVVIDSCEFVIRSNQRDEFRSHRICSLYAPLALAGAVSALNFYELGYAEALMGTPSSISTAPLFPYNTS